MPQLRKLLVLSPLCAIVLLTTGCPSSDAELGVTVAVPGTALETATTGVVANNGDFVLAGRRGYFSTVTPYASRNLFLLRATPAGEFVWAKSYNNLLPGQDAESTTAVKVLSLDDGGFAVLGQGTRDYDVAVSQMVALRTNGDGDVAWSKVIRGGKGVSARATCLEPAADGGFFAGGSLESPQTAGQGALLVRLSADGEEEWSYTPSAGDNCYGDAVAPTADGGAVLAGRCFYEQTAFLAKVNEDGEEEWLRQYHLPPMARGLAVAVSATGYEVAGFEGLYEDTLYFFSTDSTGEFTHSATATPGVMHATTAVLPASDGGWLVVGNTSTQDALVPQNDLAAGRWTIDGQLLWEGRVRTPGRYDACDGGIALPDGGCLLLTSDGDVTLYRMDAEGETIPLE